MYRVCHSSGGTVVYHVRRWRNTITKGDDNVGC